MGGKERGDARVHREFGGGRRRARANGAAEFAQEQDLHDFADVVSGLPVPQAFGVGAAEGRSHRGAQHVGGNRLAARDWTEQLLGRVENGRKRIRRGHCGRERSRWNHGVHGKGLQESGNGRTGRRSLEPARFKPVPAVLSLLRVDRHKMPMPTAIPAQNQEGDDIAELADGRPCIGRACRRPCPSSRRWRCRRLRRSSACARSWDRHSSV